MKKQFLFNALLFLGIFFSVQYSFSQVKIGENIEQVSPYALLELESNTQGLILPRMTTQQRDNAFDQNTPVGMVIFNIDQGKLEFFREAIDPSGRKTGLKVWEAPKEGIDVLGSGASLPPNPVVGQLYFDTTTNSLFLWEGMQWVNVLGNNLNQAGASSPQTLTLSQTLLSISEGNSVDLATLSLQGPQGPQGEQGPQGPAGLTTTATGTAQMLSASSLSAGSTMTLAISDGNTVTLDLSGLEDTDTNTDSQTLTVSALSAGSTMTLAISEGNTITLDLSALEDTDTNTDSQTLTASALSVGSTMTIAISEGNTITLDLSALEDTDTNTDSQTLTVSALSAGSTMTLAISEGNTITLDLSALEDTDTNTDSQTLTASVLSAGSTMTLAISDGNTVTLDLSALEDTDTNTDSQTLTASALSAGSTITIAISEGNTITLDLSTLRLDELVDTDGDTQVQVEEGTDDDSIRFDTAGTERVVIDNTGNVGIGTTTPSQKLDVVGNAEIGTAGEEAHIGYVGANNWAGFAHKDRASLADYALIQQNTGKTHMNAASGQSIGFSLGNVEKMSLASTGNVGIGTTAPSQKLDIVGNAEIGTAGEEAHIGNVGANDWAGFAHKDRASINNYALIQHTSGITQVNAASGQYIDFRITNTPKMRLATNGNFGIGTTSPDEKLSIASGAVLVENPDFGLAQANLTTTGTIDLTNVKEDLILTRHQGPNNQGGGFAGALIDFRSNNSAHEWTTAQIIGLTHSGSTNFSGGLAFATQDGGISDPDGVGTRTRGGDPQIRMLIQADGDVGIGTTNPGQTLTVSGTAHVTGQLYDSSGDAGSTGQVLSSTATGTNWVTLSTTGLIDTDLDTQIQVEETTDDDTIRFDAAGTEVVAFRPSEIQLNTAITANNTLAVSGNTTLTADLVVQGNSTLATTTLNAALQDYEGDNGTAGQVLSSTGTSTNWVTISTTGLIDADLDTQIQVEEGTDEDTIRLDAAGVEVASFTSTETQLNTDVRIGSTTARRDFRFTGALYGGKVRETATTTGIVWQEDDFCVVVTAETNLALPPATPAEAGRIISIRNNSGSPRQFIDYTSNMDQVPENFSDIRAGVGVLFISTGSIWHVLAGR